MMLLNPVSSSVFGSSSLSFSHPAAYSLPPSEIPSLEEAMDALQLSSPDSGINHHQELTPISLDGAKEAPQTPAPDLQSLVELSEFYPVILTPKESEKPFYLDSQDLRTLKKEVLKSKRENTAPWMIQGRLIEFPHSVRTEFHEVTDGFIESDLGKKALDIAELFFQHVKKKPFSATRLLVELGWRFANGCCLGQSYALVIAYSKVEVLDPKKLFELINKAHVFFFQITEFLSRQKVPTDSTFSLHVIEPIQQKIMEVIEERSGWKGKAVKLFDLSKEDDEDEIFALLRVAKNSLVEIGCYYSTGKGDHSILVFLTKEIALYDSEIGFARYLAQEAFVSDFQNYVAARKQRKNKLSKLSLTFFCKT